MATNLQRLLLLLLLLASVFTYSAIGEDMKYINDEIPFFVQDSLLEYSDEIGDHNMTGSIRKIYRKDLSPGYVAYYELQFGDQFFVFSSGPKTGDHRLVEEGKLPRPTDILIDLANKTGYVCHKFFRLSPDGVTICEDRSGKAIASTMDLKTETAGENSPNLDDEIKEDLNELAEHWRKLAQKIQRSLHWKAIEIHHISKIASSINIVSEVLEPGDSFSLPTGTSKLSGVEISVNYQRVAQRRGSLDLKALCSVLENACSGSSTKVNINHVLKANGYLRYIQLKVNDDYEFVKKTLQNKDITFYVQLQIRGKTVVRKYFTIRSSYQQSKRSAWGIFHEYKISYEHLMPDYDQHITSKGCYSGCTPVAWAQIFAYYDIRAHKYGFFSKAIYQGYYGNSGSASEIAPSYLNHRAKKFIEYLGVRLRTYCSGRSGTTSHKSSNKLDSWFRARQPGGRVRKLRSIFEVSKFVRKGYPVMNSIWWIGDGGKKNKDGHSVVVTKVKERSREYRRCRKVGWFWGRKTRCEWKRAYDYQWYRRLGWGGIQNGWYSASLRSAFAAAIYK